MRFFLLFFIFILNIFNASIFNWSVVNRHQKELIISSNFNLLNKRPLFKEIIEIKKEQESLLNLIKNKKLKLIYKYYLNYINLKMELKYLYNEPIDINFYKENIKNLNEEISNNKFLFYNKDYKFIEDFVIFKKNLNIFNLNREALQLNYLKYLPEIMFQINKIKEKFDIIKNEIQKINFNDSDHKNFFNDNLKKFLNEEENINFMYKYYIEKYFHFFKPKLLFDINNHNK